MNWQIKHYDDLSKDELYKIIKERIDVFVVEQTCPYPECDNKDQQSYHVYAIKGDDVVAYARVIPKGISYEEPSIGRVLVNNKYRSKGLGKVLMDKAIEYITEELKEDKIRISAQEYLLDFYMGLGFEKVSEVYLEDDIPHMEMLYIK